MGIHPTPFWPFSPASGLVAAAVAVYVWPRRSVHGAYIAFGAMVSIAELCIAATFEERSTTLAAQVLWQHVQIVGYVTLPVWWFLLVLSYVGRPIAPRRAAALFVVPGAAVIANWTNRWHHLYWSRIWIDRTAMPVMGRAYGAAFWFFMSYHWVILAWGVFLLLRSLPANRVQRRRTMVFLGSMLLPLAANVLFLVDWAPIRYLDITPNAFFATGLAMVWVIFRYQFQGIVPVAARLVVESIGDAVVALNVNRRVADLNPAAEALLDCRKQDRVGRTAEDLFRSAPDWVPFYQGNGKIAGDVALELDGCRKLCAAAAVDVMRGPVAVGRVITFHDVTAERAAGEELRRAHEAAEAASIAKSRFLANMSHELRTPMHAVVGATELLLDSGLDDEQLQLVKVVQESAHGLLSIINDILDFSKITAGKLELEQIPFDLHRLMDQIVRSMQPAAAKKEIELGLRIAPEVPSTVSGDPTRLRQVILNLLSNAMKFTAAGSVAVGVDPAPAAASPARIRFSVEDTGIGIAPDRIGVLFQEFSQADSSVTRKYGGTGLGLAISQRLTEKMGGAIHVESEFGRGSKFIVEIPLRLADERTISEPPRNGFREGATFRGRSVLLTEDNPVNQKIGQRMLEKLGCQVDVASNGREAVALAQSKSYDLILMDLHMPEMDGLEATREIRERGIHTPIVALTASAMDENRSTCEAAGMDSFITKPIHINDLISLLKDFCH